MDTTAAIGAHTPKVKALEWGRGNRSGSYIAHGTGIMYGIDTDHDGAVLAKWEGSGVIKSLYADADKAKAAAQADYERRVLSALDLDTHRELIATLEQRAEAAERERDELRSENERLSREVACYKKLTASRFGFTYEPTGERVTVFAETNRAFTILAKHPEILSTLRAVSEQLDFADSSRATLSEKGDE